MRFKLHAQFKPQGDQPQAIAALVAGINNNIHAQTLLGVTGSGKTFTIANVIEQVQLPTMIISHNKTLAAQLYEEFKEFFPENAVEYFVSFYDYYQPEAYIPASDTFIEKDSTINEEIDRLRLKATSSLLSRRDTIVVASVSCIYNIGSPESYGAATIALRTGMQLERTPFIKNLVDMHYTRNDMTLARGTFRVRGDVYEIMPAYEELALRIETFGDTIESIKIIHPVSAKTISTLDEMVIFPARHFVTSRLSIESAISAIYHELEQQLTLFRSQNKLVEAQRLEQRTNYDIEMLREVGFVNGIENYSCVLDGRDAGSRPYALLDFFKKPYLLIIDESHASIPQIRGMYNGDRARKTTLVEHGFRLPSALDNRPLLFNEFEALTDKVIYMSATPADYELQQSMGVIVEQVIRPTFLVDPPLEVKPAKNQVDDLIDELRATVGRRERALVTTLTKKMAEDLAEYLASLDFKARYLHSDIDTLERTQILRDLRSGVFDVLIGINLLREGLDLPEVALVAILDADKEGFLRSTRSLIQTAGRAARNLNGRIILYADTITDSISRALSETARRRQKQLEYNREHGTTPRSVKREIRESLMYTETPEKVSYPLAAEESAAYGKKRGPLTSVERTADSPAQLIKLQKQMQEYALNLEFEKAAALRDRIAKLGGKQ